MYSDIVYRKVEHDGNSVHSDWTRYASAGSLTYIPTPSPTLDGRTGRPLATDVLHPSRDVSKIPQTERYVALISGWPTSGRQISMFRGSDTLVDG